ncbi:hypothetical protein HUF15_40270 [Streptomyces samsunensis]|uniref:helix-turn-helix transcriptional regulator n=1 Tax=Streptomyces malaysiensis TaxID=92644 RepID=UPI001583A9C1|nr:hypothetical protein [Streptomyces samsunensis]NUH42861.1 hypothetical protein [Streptomyces samsunensis]
MTDPADSREVTTAEIIKEFGTSAPRISEWHRNRDSTGFPAVHRVEGRRQYWLRDDVAAWFAQREKAANEARPELPTGDPNDLLTAAEVAKLLGFSSAATIYKYLRDDPGYFPQPDHNGTLDTAGSKSTAKKHWRRGTVTSWAKKRPGKGRATGTRRPAEPLPEVPATGDPDELLTSAEAASLLGYSTVKSFASARSHGHLSALAAPDAMKPGKRGPARPMWKRSTVLAAAQQRRG